MPSQHPQTYVVQPNGVPFNLLAIVETHYEPPATDLSIVSSAGHGR